MCIRDRLRNMFGTLGEIESINIPKKQEENSNQYTNGVAFITFLNSDDAHSALKLNNSKINDRIITVSLADQKPYLERQEVKRILLSRNKNELEKIISLYPMSDRVSKFELRSFIEEKCHMYDNIEHIKDIHLVPDHNGALLVLSNNNIAAKYSMILNLSLIHI